MGAVISDRQNAADCLQWSTICCAAGAVWGSVLGPLLYLLYTAELALVVTRHGLNLHQYADDTQVSTSARDAEAAVVCLNACLVDIKAWLKVSRLRLNPTKTQVMWLGSPQQVRSASDVDRYQRLRDGA